jgi:hypothetical protein
VLLLDVWGRRLAARVLTLASAAVFPDVWGSFPECYLKVP